MRAIGHYLLARSASRGSILKAVARTLRGATTPVPRRTAAVGTSSRVATAPAPRLTKNVGKQARTATTPVPRKGLGTLHTARTSSASRGSATRALSKGAFRVSTSPVGRLVKRVNLRRLVATTPIPRIIKNTGTRRLAAALTIAMLIAVKRRYRPRRIVSIFGA